MTATIHRWAVGLSPIVIGGLTAGIQGLTEHRFDPWVIGAAMATGTLSAFISYLRSQTPAIPEVPK